MNVFWIPPLAILMLLHQTLSASNTTEVIKAVGESVTFRSHNTDKNPALWNFGNEAIVAVAFEDPPQPLFFKDKFKTRFAVSESGRALSISQLRMEDAGTYSVTIGGEKSTFTLQVFRELAEPTVTCEAQNCSNGSCSFSLRCSVPSTSFGNVSYTWRVQDQTWDGVSVVLQVNESSQDELTCTARNPVSSQSVTVTTSGVLCHGAHSSSQVGGSVGVGIMVAVGIGVLVLLLVFLIFRKSTGWRKSLLSKSKPTDTEATAEYTTVYAEVGPSQQRVPNGVKAKPADGGCSSTVYSLVKRPDQVDDGTAENATTTILELV